MFLKLFPRDNSLSFIGCHYKSINNKHKSNGLVNFGGERKMEMIWQLELKDDEIC